MLIYTLVDIAILIICVIYLNSNTLKGVLLRLILFVLDGGDCATIKEKAVLMLEASCEIIYSIRNMLKITGVKVIVVKTEQELWNFLHDNEGRIDLILADTLLKGQSTACLISRIKMHQRYKKTPVWILSSRNSICHGMSFGGVGIEGNIKKPLVRKQFLNIIMGELRKA